MEFDVTRVYGPDSADQLKPGSYVIVADTEAGLRDNVQAYYADGNLSRLEVFQEVQDQFGLKRFCVGKTRACYNYAYLMQENEVVEESTTVELTMKLKVPGLETFMRRLSDGLVAFSKATGADIGGVKVVEV